jgi:hypothetical protein
VPIFIKRFAAEHVSLQCSENRTRKLKLVCSTLVEIKEELRKRNITNFINPTHKTVNTHVFKVKKQVVVKMQRIRNAV